MIQCKVLFISLWVLLGFDPLCSVAQKIKTPNEIRTEIIIHAPVDSVWRMLVQTEAYPDWHPYLLGIKGKLVEGKMLTFLLKEESGKKNFKARLLFYRKNESMSWGGSLGFIFRAKHYIELQSLDTTHTKVIQGEYWRGWFGKSFGKKIYVKTYENFEKMNTIMKQRLEHF